MSPQSSPVAERTASEPSRQTRACECPCHAGDEVFHVVECCGSVLGRRRSRESLVPLEALRPTPDARELR
jgi:hypothetical protein